MHRGEDSSPPKEEEVVLKFFPGMRYISDSEKEYIICDYLHGLDNRQEATVKNTQDGKYTLEIKGQSANRGQLISNNSKNQAVLEGLFSTNQEGDFRFYIPQQ